MTARELMVSDRRVELGELVATIGVAALMRGALARAALALSVARHLAGDWGEVCDTDAALNDAALTKGNRLVSVYTIGDEKIYIITEADRSVTTIMLREEY